MRVRNWAKGAVVALAIAMVGATASAGTLEDVQSAGVLRVRHQYRAGRVRIHR